MKKLVLFTAISFALLSFTSCTKWDKKKEDKSTHYFSTDYKTKTPTFLGHDVADIDALYAVFFHEKKVLKYKLVAEKELDNEKDEVLAFEEGIADVDDQLNIVFTPNETGSSIRNGHFENDKQILVLDAAGAENSEIEFLIED